MSRSAIETGFERLLFAARWLLAPMYLGLVVILALLVFVFLREVVQHVPEALNLTGETAILSALTLIDLTLTANLIVIVIFSGYENFLSRLDLGDEVHRPGWLGSVDFATLKMKLIASIVAISAVDLLKRYMAIGTVSLDDRPMADPSLFWPTVIHLVFVLSAVLLALTDWLTARSAKKGS